MDDPVAALQVLDDAIELRHRTNECMIDSELYRLRSEIRMQLATDPQLVKHDLQQALEIARQQGAKSLELRAAMSLVRYQNQFDPTNHENDMLRQILNSFTEGFDTADILEARTLLQ
jgi:predicted ATPase